MALQASDFIEPAGELSEELFPGKNLTTYASAWLTEAQGKTSDEDAQREWVYHRAYQTVANRLNAQLISEQKGDLRGQRSDSQNAYYSRLAKQHLDNYNALTGTGPAAVLTAWSVDT